jgi:hypothetical protein
MSRPSTGAARGVLGLLVLAALIALVALPALAADPSGSPAASESPSATAAPSPTAAPTPAPTATATAAPTATAVPQATNEPDATAEPEKSPKPDKAPKAEKGPETEVTVTGTVGTRTDADGETEYTLTAGATLLVLDGGPSWFYGDDHPLKAYVGKRVTITGSQRAGQTELDVATVDGKRIRAEGKPLWAGGWKRVGERHPGWTQEKLDRWQAKAAGKAKALGVDCWPPGHCKDKPGKGGAAADDMTGADAGG